MIPSRPVRLHALAHIARWCRRSIALAAVLGAAALAQGQEAALPSFAELEAAGARIGEIRTVAREIFDTSDPKEDRLPFRWANALHIATRPGVIERALLFKSGDRVSVAVIDETERLLRNNRYLYDVRIRPVAMHDGVVDIEVETRDTWSLDPGLSAGRSGGTNSSGIHLKDYNFLGSGIGLSLGHSKTVDRSSNEVQFLNDRAFGGWTALSLSLAQNSDGRREAVSVAQPFYALDSRWAAGFSASRDNRIDAVYNAGNIVSQYRHRQTQAEAYGGWSAGREDGWVRRTSVGLGVLDDGFAPEPGLALTTPLPPDQKLVAPFVRYELIEERFEKLQNRNLMARPEFIALGLDASVQLGYAASAFGSSQDALLYDAAISRGFEPAPQQTLIAAANLAGRITGGRVQRQRLGGSAQYYAPQGPSWLFYAAASGNVLTNPDPSDALQLGGDTGLRGYPLRYQSGNRLALLTLEERVYTDIYMLRLFRVGGAVFADAGRAWGGDNTNTAAPGWLGNAGFGLRIVSVRAAFSNVLHVDIAFPLNAPPDVKKVQFLVKTQATF